MLQVQTSDWKNFGLRVEFEPNDWAYVALVRLAPYSRNVSPTDGEVMWRLLVDSCDSGGAVNAAARVVAWLVQYVSTRESAEVTNVRALDLQQMRDETHHVGLLQLTRNEPDCHPYSADAWLSERSQLGKISE